MPNYCLYAELPDNIKLQVQNVVSQFRHEFESTGAIIYSPNEAPHITIAYGPELPEGEEEILTNDAAKIETIYPNFMKEYVGVLPTVYYRGVAHFDRPSERRFILGLEFECQTLTDMRTHVYSSSPAMIKRKQAEKNKITNVLYDRTWDDNPARWIHATIAVLDKSKCDLPLMQQFVRDRMLKFPSTINITQIQLVSAVQDKVIPLW